ncbi:lipoprotein LpqN [Mycobacteroides abscessus subsp. bolletii]|uniref:LpqN/LpqT family lipoprotein n=1 Tax=Mycobacteroides abscessus TaxID=36809 RepID=UPI0009A58E76|nr:LpqN/LpqT family lipoprotein [Mycobacteroides abscessus]SLI92390.1 lipoprotein LpqN [Mycobacteroides abscessus subsp. bolletii]
MKLQSANFSFAPRRSIYGVLKFATTLVLAVGILASACSTKQAAEDASSTATPATDVTLDQYFKDHGVTVEPQTQETLKSLKIGLQQPPGWYVNANFQIPNTYLVVTNTGAIDGAFAPNAVIIVHKLLGKLDARDAIRRGYVDTQRYKNFQQTGASLADYKGSPSAQIAGTFENDSGQSLKVSNRYVIASSGEQNFIVLLSITTTAAQANALSRDVQALDNGLDISM